MSAISAIKTPRKPTAAMVHKQGMLLRKMLNEYLPTIGVEKHNKRGWLVQTSLGLLEVHTSIPYGDLLAAKRGHVFYPHRPTICTKFQEPNTSLGNPRNGKWNFHFDTAEASFGEFTRGLSRYLMAGASNVG